MAGFALAGGWTFAPQTGGFAQGMLALAGSPSGRTSGAGRLVAGWVWASSSSRTCGSGGPTPFAGATGCTLAFAA